MTEVYAAADEPPAHPSGTPVEGRLGALAQWLAPRTRVLLFDGRDGCRSNAIEALEVAKYPELRLVTSDRDGQAS